MRQIQVLGGKLRFKKKLYTKKSIPRKKKWQKILGTQESIPEKMQKTRKNTGNAKKTLKQKLEEKNIQKKNDKKNVQNKIMYDKRKKKQM